MLKKQQATMKSKEVNKLDRTNCEEKLNSIASLEKSL